MRCVYQGALQYHRNPVNGELILGQDGEPIPLTIPKHSDTLLMFTLKSRDRARYADRTEITGPDGGPLETADVSTVRSGMDHRLGRMTGRMVLERTVTTERVTVDGRRGNGKGNGGDHS